MMPEKCKKIAHLINKVCKLKYYKLKQFQELSGKLEHDSFGISGGKGIFLPIYRAIKTTEDYVKITLYLVAALKGMADIGTSLSRKPNTSTNTCQLIYRLLKIHIRMYIEIRGLITSGLQIVQPLVFKYTWTQEIQNKLVSHTNPKCGLTINNLEIGGLILR